jgi:hypothetical protein
VDNRLIVASVQMRLGQTQAARDSMRKFYRALKRVDRATSDGAVSMSATDWLPLQLLLPEAEAVVVYDPVFPADPFAAPGTAP